MSSILSISIHNSRLVRASVGTRHTAVVALIKPWQRLYSPHFRSEHIPKAVSKAFSVLSNAPKDNQGNEGSWEILKSVLAAGKEEKERKKREALEKGDVIPSEAINSTSISRMLQLVKPESKNLGIAVGTLGISTGISLLFPAAIGTILDLSLANGGETGWSSLEISLGLLGLFGVHSALIVLRSALLTVSGERLSANIRKALMRSILSQEPAWFDKNRVGDVVNRLSSDTKVLQNALTSNITNGLRSSFMALGSAGMLFATSPSLALLSLSLIPPVALAGMTYGRYVQGQQARVQEALGGTVSVAEEAISNIRTIRLFTAEKSIMDKFNDKVRDSFKLARRIGIVAAYFDGGVHLAANMGLIAVLGYGGSLVASGDLTPGALTAFLVYSVYTGINIASMSNVYTELKRASGAAERIFEIIDRQPTTPLSGEPVQDYWNLDSEQQHYLSARTPPNALRTLDSVKGALKFNDVTFAYPTRPDAKVLDNFSLGLEPGSSTAIVGTSGSGKSTLVSLLSRLYEPQAGTVSLDGVDINELDPTWLRSQISVVQQEPALFAMSIADNIAFAKPDATREQIIAAAKEAQAHKFISEFPEGYDTPVGERGAQLSGGQKQRIAIARAILKGSPILLLDEVCVYLCSFPTIVRCTQRFFDICRQLVLSILNLNRPYKTQLIVFR